jgi:XTP/dITP diphosphohydrolase
LILASRNAHKVDELARIAPWVDWILMPPELPDPPETGDSFVANALQKAEFVFARTGLAALADDSGIAVDALGGRPGVLSKRYSPEANDPANNALLLRELEGAATRTGRYHCAIALVGPGFALAHEDTCEGQIGLAPRGSGGFGYDPLFLPREAPGRSMAELSAAEKDAISHRGRAMRGLPALLARAGLV